MARPSQRLHHIPKLLHPHARRKGHGAATSQMNRPNLVRDRFIRDLNRWLTPSLLYHRFTGEGDPYRLAHVAQLDPWLQEPLLNKVEREWPARLEQIAEARRIQKQKDKKAVKQFVLTLQE